MTKIQTTAKRTFVELVVGVTVVALALITLLTPQHRQRTSAARVSSVNNLKQVFYAPANGIAGKDVRTPSPDR